ncbi:hypothetical protein MGSAQ_000485 [marine sediment metagenome]|uniref:Uncharacterized protein n=1 Tax=marine sediment metagenome TaxID=412755 RepID=A0A1B6NX69_9ZZZZ
MSLSMKKSNFELFSLSISSRIQASNPTMIRRVSSL